jgi:hypothetical protein
VECQDFDTFTATVHRRGLLRAARALLGLALLPAADATAQLVILCDRKKRGRRCRRDADCCSGRCQRKRSRKRGTCLCSQWRQPCSETSDCCDPEPGELGDLVCSTHDDVPDLVCCGSIEYPCQTNADCCSGLECTGNLCG